jgi:hypothetical protein
MPTSCRAPCLRTSNCCISSSDRCRLVRPELPSPNTTPRVISTGLQYAIDRRAADLEGLCDLRCPKPLCLHCAHLGGVYRGRPPLIDARSFGLGDAHGFFGFLGIRVSLFASSARPYQNKNPTSAIGLTAACATGLEGMVSKRLLVALRLRLLLDLSELCLLRWVRCWSVCRPLRRRSRAGARRRPQGCP